MNIYVIAALSVFSATAAAAPPLAGSDDYDALMPYAGWMSRQLAKDGLLCCSVSDCRIVAWRTDGSGYQALITEKDHRGFEKFPHAPNDWISVPDAVIKREPNPTGQAVACWSDSNMSHHGYYCFFLPDMG